MSDYNSRNGSSGDNRQDNKSVKGTTPAGEAVFPRLVEPSTKFDDDGVYSLKLRIKDSPEADKLIAQIEAVQEQAFNAAIEAALNPVAKKKIKRAEPSYTRDLDRDTGEDTGHWLFNFKMKASGVSKKTGKAWTRKPALFDSKGKPITHFTKNEELWSGSIVKVAFELRPFVSPSFGAGCSQTLQAVQVIECVSGDGKTAQAYGFDEEEDGFSTPTAPVYQPFDGRSNVSGKDGDDDSGGDF